MERAGESRRFGKRVSTHLQVDFLEKATLLVGEANFVGFVALGTA